MPQTIEFGGTNGLGIVELGLPGGSAWPGSAASVLNLIPGPAKTRDKTVAMPDISFIALERGAYHGRNIVARGTLVFANRSVLVSALTQLDERSWRPDSLQPTRLRDTVNSRIWEETVLMNVVNVESIQVDGRGWFLQEIELQFNALKESVVG